MISLCNTVSWCAYKQPKLTRSKVRFEVSTAMTFRIPVLWVVMQSNRVHSSETSGIGNSATQCDNPVLNLLVPTNAHIILIYISPYFAPTGFGWLQSSESSKPNSLKLKAIN